MRKILLLIALLVVLTSLAFQTEPPADWTNLTAVLIWLAGLGSVVAVGWLVANFLEKMEWWNKLPSFVKWIVPPAIAVLVALGAQYLLKQEIVLAQIQPYFALIVSILLTYLGLQAGHNATKAARLRG